MLPQKYVAPKNKSTQSIPLVIIYKFWAIFFLIFTDPLRTAYMSTVDSIGVHQNIIGPPLMMLNLSDTNIDTNKENIVISWPLPHFI